MILILLFGDNSEYAIIALTAAATHELGHIITALVLKMKLDSFSLGLFGARLGIALPLYSYRHELMLSLSGPIANLLTGSAALYIYHIQGSSEHVLFFAVASFFLALLNLLPIKGFDGGRIFICLSAPPLGIYVAERLLELLSFVFVLMLWILSIYLMLKVGSSLALFVFSAALFAELFLNAETF